MEHNNAAVAQGAELLCFTEESCWTKAEQRRERTIPVTFTVQSVGKRLGGVKVSLEFEDDYGLYYDSDDDRVIQRLSALEPRVQWGAYVYYRQSSMTKIEVLDPDTDKPVATITTRKYIGKPIDQLRCAAGEYGSNVTPFSGIRGRLDVLASLAQQRELERKQRHAALRAAGIITDER